MSLSGEATSPSSASSLAAAGVAPASDEVERITDANGDELEHGAPDPPEPAVPYIQIDPPFGVLNILVPGRYDVPATVASYPPEVLPADIARAVATIRDFALAELAKR